MTTKNQSKEQPEKQPLWKETQENFLRLAKAHQEGGFDEEFDKMFPPEEDTPLQGQEESGPEDRLRPKSK
jgi:hypothetical protein